MPVLAGESLLQLMSVGVTKVFGADVRVLIQPKDGIVFITHIVWLSGLNLETKKGKNGFEGILSNHRSCR